MNRFRGATVGGRQYGRPATVLISFVKGTSAWNADPMRSNNYPGVAVVKDNQMRLFSSSSSSSTHNTFRVEEKKRKIATERPRTARRAEY